MNEGEKGEPVRLPPCPPKRKGAETTDTCQGMEELLILLWNYIIEVQDIIAELRALAHVEQDADINPAAQAKTPAQMIAEIVDQAKGNPIRVGDA